MKAHLVLLVALWAALPCRVAEAEPSSHDAAAMKAARPFAEKGFELFKGGRYAESIEQFKRADARYHAPPHLLYMARAHHRLNELVEARDLYRRILTEPIDDAAPQAFHRAVVEARAELGEVEESIPTVVLEISGVELDRATVTIDGRTYGALPESIQLNPGEHEIEVTAPDRPTQSHTVTLEAGDRRRLPIDMPSPGEPAAEDPLLVPALVAFGVGGLGLLVGTITGAVSLSQAADIDDQCQGDHCPASLESDADSAKAVGHASTAFFIIAGLAAGTGATLLLIRSQSGPDDAASLRLRLSVGAIGVDGTF